MSIDNRTELDRHHQQQRQQSRVEQIARALFNGELVDAVFGAVSVNELGLDQKMDQANPGQPQHDDPVALRYGAWANPLGRACWYIAKESFDVLRWKDGRVHRTEGGFWKKAIDELRDRDGRPMPLVALYLTRDAESSNDSDMQPVLIATRDGIRFTVPVFMEAGSDQGGAPASRVHDIWSPDGLFVTQQNPDGNFTTYELARPYDKGRFRALWSAWSGRVANPKWEGV